MSGGYLHCAVWCLNDRADTGSEERVEQIFLELTWNLELRNGGFHMSYEKTFQMRKNNRDFNAESELTCVGGVGGVVLPVCYAEYYLLLF